MSNVCVLSVLFCFVLFRGEGGGEEEQCHLTAQGVKSHDSHHSSHYDRPYNTITLG